MYRVLSHLLDWSGGETQGVVKDERGLLGTGRVKDCDQFDSSRFKKLLGTAL